MNQENGDQIKSVSEAMGFSPEFLKKNSSLIFVEGGGLIILGVAAILFPHIFSQGFELFTGFMLAVAGLAGVFRTFSAKAAHGLAGALIMSIIFMLAGIFLLFEPLRGLMALTLILALFFMVEGIGSVIMAFQAKPATNWSWFIMNGIVSFILGGLIFAGLPSSAFWALGLLVGIKMLFAGLTLMMLGHGLKKMM